MDDNDKISGNAGPSLSSNTANPTRHGSAAPSTIQSAADTIKDEATSIGGKARALAEDKAESVKGDAASHMHGFADALKSASETLKEKQAGPASEMVSHAASGLEQLSRSLEGKSTGAMVESVRRFGRENPIGFLAGSMLAGFALVRFATAAPSSDEQTDTNGATSSYRPTGYGSQAGGITPTTSSERFPR
jgi:hypothetical protein